VEDNASVRRMLAKSLQMKGYEVCASPDARDGIQAFQDFEPQVAIIDIGLPDVDGNELARWIRQSDRERQTTLVAVSGFTRESDQVAAIESGFDLHIKKPIEPNALLRAVAEHCLAKSGGS
jgi:two-component system CheB/CheR fusion protein